MADLMVPEDYARMTEALQRRLPAEFETSSVPIVWVKDQKWGIQGTGTLFQIGDSSLLVTAAHVLQIASAGYGLAIGVDDGGLVPLTDGYGVPRDRRTLELHDVGIAKIPIAALSRLLPSRFLHLRDVRFDDPSDTALFALQGFPGKMSDVDGEMLSMSAVQFTGIRFRNPAPSVQNFDGDAHILVDSQPQYTRNPDGTLVDFRDYHGKPLSFPKDVGGISGASLWEVADYNLHLEGLGQKPPRVVGVETSVYSSLGAIKATRWIHVAELISTLIPESRPLFDLMWPN
jgi:hypothetical protein